MLIGRRMLAAPLVLVLALALLGGCSDSNPSGPSTIVGCLHIGGSYIRVTGDPPQGFAEGASITIRYGSATGPIASGLEVDINDHPLAFYPPSGAYAGVVPALTPGDSLKLSISDGLGTISRTVLLPHPPSELELVGDSWDISGPSALNTLRWENPAVLGEAVVVRLYDYDGWNAVLLLDAASGDAGNSDFTIPNSQLAYYETLEGVGAVVAQMEYVGFPAGAGLSVLAATIHTWPVTSGE